MSDGVTRDQRFTAQHPCPICNGFATMPQGKGIRCYGFLSEDGEYAHCSREDPAGDLDKDQAGTFAHKLYGDCKCRVQHNPARDEQPKRPVSIGALRERKTGDTRRAPDVEYEYRDEAARVVGVKGRWNIPATVEGEKDDKDIAWRAPNGTYPEGLRKYGLSVEQMPLYHADKLAQLPKGSVVYFVEGEKAADACIDAGLVDWRETGVTTNAGGATQTRFGSAFDVLEGQHLRPWADNDPQGRKLMRTIRPIIEHRILSWRPVIVSVPEAGDAYDFFFPREGSGYEPGTPEQVVEQALRKPVTERLDEETIRVRLPSPVHNTPVVFVFSEIQRQRRAFRCVLETHLMGAQHARRSLRYDIDLLSLSGVDSYRRMLDRTFGDDHDWHELLTVGISEMREAWANSASEVDGADIQTSEGDELLMAVDRLVPHGEHVVVYGRRDSTKSYQVLQMIACASLGIPYAGLTTSCEGPWVYIDNETNERNFGRRLHRIWRGLGFKPGEYPRGRIIYVPARGRSVPDMVDDLKPKLDQWGAVGIAVDSAVGACGGDPADALAVAHYFAVCDRFQRTMITIAHVPKPDKEHAKLPTDPFGSTVWSNKARACWRVDRSPGPDNAPVVSTRLVCTKGNDLPDKSPLYMDVHFDEDNGPVNVRQVRANAAPRELKQDGRLIDRIWDVLQHGAMTAFDITVKLNDLSPNRVDAKTVKDTCYRHTLADAKPRLVAIGDQSGGAGNQVRYGRMGTYDRTPQRIAVGQTHPAVVEDVAPSDQPADDIPL